VYLRAEGGKTLNPHSLSVFVGQDAPSR
jgi:hypothetical protein